MSNPFSSDTPPATLTVSQLNRQARTLLESHFDFVWVEGEISNFAAPSSGHWYFTLKDGQAQVRCAMFRMKRQRLRFQPENGMQVLLRGRVSLPRRLTSPLWCSSNGPSSAKRCGNTCARCGFRSS